MTSDRSKHTAELWPTPEHGESPTMWRVSWLPERPLGRNEATTAMILADLLAEGIEWHDPFRLHIDSFAAELGLSTDQAVARASEPPEIEWEP
jgi:hypothetical protein